MYKSLEHSVHRYQTNENTNSVYIKLPNGHNVRYYASKMRAIRGFSVYAAECPIIGNLGIYYTMILQEGINSIFVLSSSDDFVEGKQLNYYESNFNDHNVSATIKKKSSRSLGGMKVNSYEITIKGHGHREKKVNLYQLSGWPDHGVIASKSLLEWVDYMLRKITGHFLVHCSAGRGRTGVTLGALYLRGENINVEHLCFRMSAERGLGVQIPQTLAQKNLLAEFSIMLYGRQPSVLGVQSPSGMDTIPQGAIASYGYPQSSISTVQSRFGGGNVSQQVGASHSHYPLFASGVQPLSRESGTSQNSSVDTIIRTLENFGINHYTDNYSGARSKLSNWFYFDNVRSIWCYQFRQKQGMCMDIREFYNIVRNSR